VLALGGRGTGVSCDAWGGGSSGGVPWAGAPGTGREPGAWRATSGLVVLGDIQPFHNSTGTRLHAPLHYLLHLPLLFLPAYRSLPPRTCASRVEPGVSFPAAY